MLGVVKIYKKGIHTVFLRLQAPEINARWSGSSRGGAEEVVLQKLHSGRRSCELQLPRCDDNSLSPGYTEPLCVSEHPTPVMVFV